ncbi:GatB/YqeY domain-containing protein [Mesorhizobium sp. NBSH29]|uniref:GatB/YqeY domain-containing protein n=1 Tax=Mesorhizobium sp. NBSH29 TaxID=2654249 RepID=UPI0018968A3A|nr:GatB/YqeY domain-containing protein [Mesorhizobium sp. NBSH29]QPC88364.1 GatB/YqeY domain-containing protein [Mesorhizobium sp. NBSH29]
MRETILAALKTALKSGDKERSGTLRLVNAAIQDRDIANRGTGKDPAGDDEIVSILTKMVKQREESAKAFDDGKRPELAAQERAEIDIIRGFLPEQMDDAALEQAVKVALAETGAASVRDMGKVMAMLKEKHGGAMDFGKASGLVKKLLS